MSGDDSKNGRSMATHPQDDDPKSSPADQSGQEHVGGDEQASRGDHPTSHGSTGEGSGSAMARLISQEQARVVPGCAEDAPTGSS
jgi:hypothetical protein